MSNDFELTNGLLTAIERYYFLIWCSAYLSALAAALFCTTGSPARRFSQSSVFAFVVPSISINVAIWGVVVNSMSLPPEISIWDYVKIVIMLPLLFSIFLAPQFIVAILMAVSCAIRYRNRTEKPMFIEAFISIVFMILVPFINDYLDLE